MYDQGSAAQHAYCPAQFEFVKQKPKTAVSQLSPKDSDANTVSGTSITRQNGSQSADSQPKPIRLPDAPLAMRQMPFACPAKAPSAVQTAKSSNQLAATFQEHPALPLRPAPSSSPAWKRGVRPAPGLTKNSDSSLLSRLSKLTSANGSPIPSGHVAGVVPPHASLHSSHHSPHHCPRVPHPRAASHQAAQAQQRQHFSSTADHGVRPHSQHSPGSSKQVASGAAWDHAHKPDTQTKQGFAQRLQADPSATAASTVGPGKPDHAAAQSWHLWEEHGPSGSVEVHGGQGEGRGAGQGHSPASQPSPPSQPTEPQVKPKSTQRSRLRLQRPAAVPASPAASHSTADPFRQAGTADTAWEQASCPSLAYDDAELDTSLLVSQPPGHSSEDLLGDPRGNSLGYPARQPSGEPSEHPPGGPLGYSLRHPSGNSAVYPPGHSPEHPCGRPVELRRSSGWDDAAHTPSASGGMLSRPPTCSINEHARAGGSALQVTSHKLVLQRPC